MPYELQNDFLKIAIKEHGAELCLLQSLRSGTHYLWQADPAVWAKHSPLLFPVIGRLNQGRYLYRGKSYAMPKHGFARDADFILLEQTSQRLLLETTDTPATRGIYPFAFSLQVEYLLRANHLHVSFCVVNRGNDIMYFSLGAHPALACPWQPLRRFDEYYLEFDKPETADRLPLRDGLIGPPIPAYLNQQQTIQLSDTLFAHDALIFTGLRSSVISLKCPGDPRSVSVTFDQFPCLGLWSKPGPFVCIEPWMGHDDPVGFKEDISRKPYIMSLAPRQSCRPQYRLSIHEPQ